MIDLFLIALEALQQFLHRENGLIKQNKVIEVIESNSEKEKLWNQYIQCLEQAQAQNIFVGDTRLYVLHRMQLFYPLLEENAQLVAGVVQSQERIIACIIQQMARLYSESTPSYNKKGHFYDTKKNRPHSGAKLMPYTVNQAS